MNNPLEDGKCEGRASDAFYVKLDEPNIFQKMEAEQKLKFNKYRITLPWYLKLFRKAVIDIAYKAFVRGLSVNAPPIKIKRPTPFKEENDE